MEYDVFIHDMMEALEIDVEFAEEIYQVYYRGGELKRLEEIVEGLKNVQ